MADSDGSPNLISTLRQVLPELLAANNGGTSGGGYVPRSATFTEGPSGLFSSAQVLGTLGPAFGQLTGSVNIGLMMSGLSQHMQAGAGTSAVQLEQQRAQMQVMGQMQFLGNNQAFASAFGHPEWAKDSTFQMLAPMLMSAVPGAMDLARSMAPTAMFTGGANIAATLSMLDPMGSIQADQAGAMRESMFRMVTKNGFMDTVASHGANMDEMAAAMEEAADMGVQANDLDMTEVRRTNRERLRKERYGGKADSQLSDDERGQLDSDTASAAVAERAVKAGEYTSQVARSVQEMLGPNATRNDALNYMQQNGMGVQSQAQANTLEETMRHLEALGKQAHITGEEMANAGRAMTAAKGGSMLYNQESYAATLAASRDIEMAVNKAGGSIDPNMVAVLQNQALNAGQDAANGANMKAVAAMYSASAEGRARVLGDYQSGNYKDILAISQEVLMQSTSLGEIASPLVNRSAEETAAVQQQITEASSGRDVAVNRQAIMSYLTQHLTRAQRTEFGQYLDPDTLSKIAQAQSAGMSPGSVIGAMGASTAAQTSINRWAVETDAGSKFLALSYSNQSRLGDKAVQDRAESTGLLDHMSDLDRFAQTGVASGQGVIANYVQGRFKGLTGAAGIEAILKARGNWQDDDLRETANAVQHGGRAADFIKAGQDEQDALKILSDGNAKGDAAAKARQQLLKAENTLSSMGLRRDGPDADSKKIQAWVQAAKDDNTAAQKAKDTASVGGAAVAPIAVNVAGSVQVNIKVSDQTGQPVPKSNYTVDATKSTGNVPLVLGQTH